MKKMDKVFRMRMSAEEREDLHRVAKREGLDDSTYMRGLLSKQSRKRLGFTLIELLVVVIIIAILTGIAVPIFLNQRKAAWKATVMTDVANAQLTTESAAAATDGVIDGMTFQAGTNASPLLIKAGSDTYKSPVSPGNTVTESIGKTADGAACYLITGSNKNVDGYSYQRSSIVNPSDCVVTSTPTYSTETIALTTYAPMTVYKGHWYWCPDASVSDGLNDCNTSTTPLNVFYRSYAGAGQKITLKPGENITLSANAIDEPSNLGLTGLKKGDDISLVVPAIAWIDGSTNKKIDTRTFFPDVTGITGGKWEQSSVKTDFIWYNGGTWDGGNIAMRLTNGATITLEVAR